MTRGKEHRPRVGLNYIEKPPRGAPKHPYIEIQFCPWCGRKYRDG